jgi:hypothetical protein
VVAFEALRIATVWLDQLVVIPGISVRTPEIAFVASICVAPAFVVEFPHRNC